MKYSIKIFEFDIYYEAKKATKPQILTYFIAKTATVWVEPTHSRVVFIWII